MVINEYLERDFGDYTLHQKLGVGGMATVYRASHNPSEREVAIKILHEHFADDEIAIKRLEREAKIAQQLQHPHIVPILAFNKALDRPYLVMPYYPNGTLAEYFRRPRRMKHGTILKVLRVLAEGLDYAHSKRVVHRDFKLENILLDTRNAPAISDFGIAQIANSTKLTATGRFLGTPHYMAPEQGSTVYDLVDYRADLYAFAVMSYLLLTGVFPFSAVDPFQLIVKHNTQVPPTPSIVNDDLPVSVDPVILQGMAKRPIERYESATLYVDALDAAFVNAPRMTTTLIDMEKPNPMSSTDPISFDAFTTRAPDTDEYATRDFSGEDAVDDEVIPAVTLDDDHEVEEKDKRRRLVPVFFLLLSMCGLASFLVYGSGGANFLSGMLPVQAESTEDVVSDASVAEETSEVELTAESGDSETSSTATEEIEPNASSTPRVTNTIRATNTVRPTNTSVPATSTRIPPTNTRIPPTAIPPTAVPPTSVPPTAVPPTAVPSTPVPPPPTNPPSNGGGGGLGGVVNTVVAPILPGDDDGTCLLILNC